MSILAVLLILFVIGVVVFLINRAPFVDEKFKKIINWVAVILTVIWLISLFVDLPNLFSGPRTHKLASACQQTDSCVS